LSSVPDFSLPLNHKFVHPFSLRLNIQCIFPLGSFAYSSD
jgi:hypothetical protein